MPSVVSEPSPASGRAVRPPLEVHSPNVAPSRDPEFDGGPAPSPGGGGPVKSPPRAAARGGPSPSPCRPPRMPAAHDEAGRDENEGSMWLSPVRSPMDVSGTPALGDRGDGGRAQMNASDGALDSSFPYDRNDVEIHGPEHEVSVEFDYDDDDNSSDYDDDDDGEVRETEEERMMREMEESEALARQLMAEEAMASYAMSTEYLQENADQFSGEDLAALQAAMAEEDPEMDDDRDPGDDGDEDAGDGSREMSYDALLRLGERIGSVKEERWAMVARERTEELCPTLCFTRSMAEGKEENHTEVKCLVCQFPYEEGDGLRRLPCGHCFHAECIEKWLETKDTCALCRKSIVASANP